MVCIARIALALALLVPWATPALTEVFRPDSSTATAPAPDAKPAPESKPAPTTAPAQPPPPEWGNSQVEIAYREPKDAQFAPIRERLMRRQVLEQLQLFLSPLKLPRKLMVQLDQCGAERRP